MTTLRKPCSSPWLCQVLLLRTAPKYSSPAQPLRLENLEKHLENHLQTILCFLCKAKRHHQDPGKAQQLFPAHPHTGGKQRPALKVKAGDTPNTSTNTLLPSDTESEQGIRESEQGAHPALWGSRFGGASAFSLALAGSAPGLVHHRETRKTQQMLGREEPGSWQVTFLVFKGFSCTRGWKGSG